MISSQAALFPRSVLVVFSLILLAGCDPNLPPTTSGGGFTIATEYKPRGGPIQLVPSIALGFKWFSDSPGAIGDASSFSMTTNVDALATRINGRDPANWLVT